MGEVDDPGGLTDDEAWGNSPKAQPSNASVTVDSAAPQSQSDPNKIGAYPTVHQDSRDPSVWRDSTGRIAYLNDTGRRSIQTKDGTASLLEGGDASPEGIATYIKQHPDMENEAHGGLSDEQAWGVKGGNLDPGQPKEAQDNSPLMQAARQVVASKPDWLKSIANADTFGFIPEIEGGIEYANTALNNMSARKNGQNVPYSASEAFNAIKQAYHESANQYAKTHPVSNLAFNVLGGVINPVSAMTGGFVGSAPTLMAGIGRGALVGAGEGALSGAGAAGGGNAGLGDRAMGALGGAAFGAGVGGVATGAVRSISSALAGKINLASASAAIDNVLNKSGLSPLSISPATRQSIVSEIAAGAHPTDATFRGMAGSLPEPVPLSVGQASGNAAQQFAENSALKGVKGNAASIVAQNFCNTQQDALRQNAGIIGDQIAGGPISPGEAGVRISGTLNNAADNAKAMVDKAYDAARASQPATFTPEGAANVVNAVRTALKGYHPEDIPDVMKHVDRLESVMTSPGSATKSIPSSTPKVFGNSDLSAYPPEVQQKIIAASQAANGSAPISGSISDHIDDVFQARRQLSQLTAESQSNPTKAGAASIAVKALDQGINDAVADGLMKGDTAGVDAWRKAIAARAQYGRVFEGDDIIERLTSRSPRNGDMRALSVDPQSATNYILGREGLTGLGNPNSSRDLRRLSDVLGPNSPDWQALKGEVFKRLVSAGEGPTNGTERTFSGSGFANAWRNAQAKYPNVITQMFSPSERAMIDQFSTVAERATKTVSGGRSTSDSDIGVANALKNVANGVFGFKIPVWNQIRSAIQDAKNASAIRRATFGAKPTPANQGSTPSALSGLITGGAIQGSTALTGINRGN